MSIKKILRNALENHHKSESDKLLKDLYELNNCQEHVNFSDKFKLMRKIRNLDFDYKQVTEWLELSDDKIFRRI